MNKKILSISILMLSSLFSSQVFCADADVQAKIQKLEHGLSDLQQQIRSLKADLKNDTSPSNAQRIANLESYAVELHDVLLEVRQQVADNDGEIERVSQAQENQPHMGMYGAISAGKTSNQNSIIDGESFEIVLSGQPHKRLSYFVELEFERAATVGGSRGGEVLLEQAYTDILLNSWSNLRAGVLLVPFGNIERDHYTPLREVISKPLTSYAIAPSDWTDNGFGLNGKFDISENWIADYQAYVIAGLDDNISSTGLRGTRQGFGEDNNNDKAFSGKIKFLNTAGNRIGFSLYRGAWDDSGNRFMTGMNVDFDYHYKWLDFTGEYTRTLIERESHGDAAMDGFYIRSIASIDHFMPDNWLSADFPGAELQLVAQYDQVDIENFFDPSIADNKEKRITLGVRVLPLKAWVFNFNYEHSQADGPDTILRGDADTWTVSVGYIF